MPAPITHDTSDAGPATTAALSAPSSHPDPMIDPSEMNVRPQKPTLRCNWAPGAACGLSASTLSAITSPPPGETCSRRRTESWSQARGRGGADPPAEAGQAGTY